MKQIRNLFIAWLVSLFISVPAIAGDIGPELKINRANGDECVRPSDDMRKNHMKYLLHQRDETVHKGIRTEQFSLKKCITCHANKDESGQYIPVTAPGEFCQSCHTYASVKLDCFECHATKPRETAFHPIVNDKMKAFSKAHNTPSAKTMLDKLVRQGDSQ